VQAARRQAPLRGVTLEKQWELTAASGGQKLAAIALGAVNIVGIGYLSLLLVEPSNQLALIQGGLGWVGAVMPFLQVGGWVGGCGRVGWEGRVAAGACRAAWALHPACHTLLPTQCGHCSAPLASSKQ
jgi:hypothetical protein